MCGNSSSNRRIIDEKENNYLLSLHRGLYLKNDIEKGKIIRLEDLYPALPLIDKENHLSSRTFIENNYISSRDLKKDMPLLKDFIR
jgi:sialic acid synthase SpsE